MKPPPPLPPAAQARRYSVIPSRRWRNADGRTASLFGAVPYRTTAEAEGWALETVGWTVRDERENRVGFGRPPFATQGEAQAFADQLEARA